MNFEDYPVHITPIPEDEGGGYMVILPDLPGCVADGATIEDAIREVRDAFNAWTAAQREDGKAIPVPKTYSGQFVQRIPKSLHRKLAKHAENEGVSLNQLATALLAQGIEKLSDPC